MENYKEFLNTLIKGHQIRSIEAMIDHVLPTLDDSAVKETRELMDAYLPSAPHKEIVDLLASKIGVNEETSWAYLIARIADPELDRLELEQHVKNLKGLYGHVQATAIFKGDVQIVKLLDQHHASRYPINFGYVSNVGPCVDGKEVKTNYEFTSFQSPGDVEYIFEIILKAGLEQLLGRNNDGSAWILGKNLSSAVMATRSAVTAPSIPVLTHGQVIQPELAISLFDRRSGSNYPELYDRILVWVDNAEVDETPGTPLATTQKFKMGPEKTTYDYHKNDPSEDFDLKDYASVMTSGKEYAQAYGDISGERAFRGIFVGLVPKTEATMDARLAYDLTQYMLTPRQRMGLDNPAGKTLVMMDLDQLLAYNIAQVDERELWKAQDFASSYFPVESLISLRDKKLVMSKDAIHCDMGIFSEQDGFRSDLFRRLADSDMAKVIADIVPRPILDRYFHECALSDEVRADNVVKAIENLGFSFTKDTYTVTMGRLARWAAAGLRFADVTDGVFTKLAKFDPRVDKNDASCLNAMQLGLWPGRANEMSLSIKDALMLAMRLKQDAEYPALLKFHGAREVAAYIKTEPQTRLFASIFSEQEVRDCLQILPKKMREACFAGDLGL